MPAAAWKEIAQRAWHEAAEDNISLVASGVAFCGVLAMVPMLGAIVLSYGLIASPKTVVENMTSLTSIMPVEAAKLIGEQLANVVHTAGSKKGFGLLLALGIALYGAMKGSGAMVTALNIAYDEEENRSFVRLNLLSLSIVLGALMLALLSIVAIAAMGHLESLFPHAPGVLLVLGKILSYLVMAGVGAAAAATLYRYGPDRDEPKWTWLTPGSGFTAIAWLIVTLGFGFYVANFGSYDATYGTLGGAIVLLTWLYLSAYILLLGAELNCELERQTVQDTTIGPAQAIGNRGAHAADTVADDGSTASALSEASSTRGATSSSPSPLKAYAAARVVNRAQRIAGMQKVGMLPTLLTTVGLALLRRKGKAPAGLALLSFAAGLSWLSRRE
jgi:membrane protein